METVGLATGGQPYQSTGSDLAPVGNIPPTLADAGIDKKLSMGAQRVAAIPANESEDILGDRRV